MAEEALQKVEDQLNCSICLDTYTDPKLLQCFHVYCQKCLVKLVIRDQQGQLNLTCPICRQITPISARGVAGLPSAFQVNKLLEIVDEHKKAKDATDGGGESTEGHQAIACSASSQKSGTQFCSEHSKKELELYCETCEDFICFHCVIKGGKHHSHDYELLEKAFEKYKDDVSMSLEPLEKQLATINESLVHLDARCGEISDRQASIEADIHNSIRQLHETLDVRKTELIGQLHQITQEKLKSLATQRDQLETTQAQLSSCLTLVKESLKAGSEGEVLRMKTGIARQVKKLTATFESDILEPSTEADMIFLPSDITTVCENYGSVSTSAAEDRDSVDREKHGEIVLSQLRPFSKAMPVEEPEHRRTTWRAHLPASPQGGLAAGTSLFEAIPPEQSGRSQVTPRSLVSHLMLTPRSTAGQRQQVQVTGRSEDGHLSMGLTPYSSIAGVGRSQPGASLASSKSKTIKVSPVVTISVEHPWDVAIIGSRGEVVVSHEQNGECVTFFSASGKKMRSRLASTQSKPHGLAVCDNRVLVTDFKNDRIMELTTEGYVVTDVGSRGTGPLKFVRPEGIAINTSSKKIYITDWNHRVQVLNSDLTFSCTFGGPGNGVGQFNSPWGVACDDITGNVYVADSQNHRIQVFTAEGKFLRMFGRFGVGYGQLNSPSGIALDPSAKTVYIGDCGNQRVSVFSTDGLFIGSFDGTGVGEREKGFEVPCGLALGHCGTLWVCDCYNNRVLAFKIDSPRAL